MSHYCLQNDPWHSCDKQECQGFSFPHKVICDTSMISADVKSIAKRYFQVVIKYSYLPFGRKHSSENPQSSHKILSRAQILSI